MQDAFFLQITKFSTFNVHHRRHIAQLAHAHCSQSQLCPLSSIVNCQLSGEPQCVQNLLHALPFCGMHQTGSTLCTMNWAGSPCFKLAHYFVHQAGTKLGICMQHASIKWLTTWQRHASSWPNALQHASSLYSAICMHQEGSTVCSIDRTGLPCTLQSSIKLGL